PAPGYILALLLTGIFTLATWLQPHALTFNQSRKQSDNLLARTLGDARRMFATHFFVKADVYFHSGYYPGIFDEGRTNETHIAEQQAKVSTPGKESAEDEISFLGPPRDWIEKFGRNFFNTEHTELSDAKVGEMLPWLRVAAELDPQRVETYTVGAFWLRMKLKKVDEAEAFLRDGLRENPDSFEILFELGRLYAEDRHDNLRARNLLELANRKLLASEKATATFDLVTTRQILLTLARVEEAEQNYLPAIRHLEQLIEVVPAEAAATKAELRVQVAELRAKVK
ncbi:MAG: hypothetical protein RLZZ350_1885, partial [Verrucomicrobiota bacterium]